MTRVGLRMETKRGRGRPLKALTVTPEDREKLVLIARRPKSSLRAAQRARIVLKSGEGLPIHRVAADVGVSVKMVGKWRERYRRFGMDGLLDEPRVGAPRKITDADVEEVVTLTLESKPKGETHWSQRSMAKRCGLSRESVGRIWRAFGLKPHRTETFKLSPDPQFIEKVRDVVGLYMNPPEHAVVLCVDEKSQIQALERTQPLLPLRPGQPERRSHDYKRHGITTLFAALNAATGEVISQIHKRHRQRELIRFLNHIDRSVPPEFEVHIVMDNYGTHKAGQANRWFAKHPRFVVHFTPTYSSWMNLVERLFAEVTQKAIRRGSFCGVRELEDAINEYLDEREPRRFVWTADADLILERVQRFCERTSVAGH